MNRPVIARSFSDGLAKLSHDDAKLAKLALADLLLDPSPPGLRQHPVQSRDPNMWSARVNDDIRIIMNKREAELVFCYVAHHDEAYAWAERRRLEVHETTGAAQFVVTDERVEEVVKRVTRIDDERDAPPERPFEHLDERALLGYAVPRSWVAVVQAATLEEFLDIGDDLPDEAREYLLRLASGEAPEVPTPTRDPFAHPDARRRFAIVGDDDHVLARALAAPWETWQLFLHPRQRDAVDRDHAGPARVTGGAGTGKTIVAIHRAVRLARESERPVLLTTFSKTLAARLGQQLDVLLATEPAVRGRLDTANLHHLAMELWKSWHGAASKVASDQDIDRLLKRAMSEAGGSALGLPFLLAEWQMVIEPHGITTWREYAHVERTARGGQLGPEGRAAAWTIMARLRALLDEQGLTTWSGLCWAVVAHLDAHDERPYAHVVADEVQDFGPAELRLLRALVDEGRNDVFLAGDVNQRIYKPRTVFARAGLEVRGRTSVLHLNYRTTEQIRRAVDRMVGPQAGDDDEPRRAGSTSLVSGPEPEFRALAHVNQEIETVATWIATLVSNGYRPAEIAVLARTHKLIDDRVRSAVARAGFRHHLLEDDEAPAEKHVAIGTMHRGKGLQFRAVVVMGAEEGVVPLTFVLDRQVDEAAKRAFLERERNLLYVACSRGRERLLVTGVGELSPFLKRTPKV